MARLPSLAALLVLAPAAAALAAQPQVPPPTALVTDQANVMSAATERRLAEALSGFRQTQQRQVSVVTVPDLQGYAIEDYTRAIREAWGLDDSRNDDGAVLLVAPNDLYVRIEVGSAVKPVLPAPVARELVQTWVVPSFQRGDMDKGVLDGTGAILAHLELPPEQAAAIAEQARLEAAEARQDEGFPWSSLLALVLLFVLWPIVRRIVGFGAASAIGLLGAGGGRGSDFGGFAGGGGGFNGGGATGRW